VARGEAKDKQGKKRKADHQVGGHQEKTCPKYLRKKAPKESRDKEKYLSKGIDSGVSRRAILTNNKSLVLGFQNEIWEREGGGGGKGVLALRELCQKRNRGGETKYYFKGCFLKERRILGEWLGCHFRHEGRAIQKGQGTKVLWKKTYLLSADSLPISG